MPIKLKNNVSSTTATTISASDVGVTVAAGTGALFPTLLAGDYFYATLISAGGTQEIVKVTARIGDSMTIIRAQDNTTAQSFAAGSRVEMRITAQSVLEAASNDFISFGAYGVGDGSTDNYDAIKLALAAAAGKRLYIPAGHYIILLPDAAGIGGIAAGTTIFGDGAESFLDIRTTGSTYLNVFGISNSNITFDKLKIKLTVFSNQLASLFIFGTGQRENISITGCELLSSNNYLTAPTHFTYLFNLPSAAGTETNNFQLLDSSIHNWYYTILKTNASQATEQDWIISRNRFYENYTAHWSPNSPSGVHKNIIISDNIFETIRSPSSGSVHHIGLATVTDCTITGNVFNGLTAGEAIHVEEACRNIVISNNTITIGELTNQVIWGDGIRFLDNDISGVLYTPTNISITGNTITRTGTVGGSGIAIQYDPRGPNAEHVVCSGNVITGFTYGIELDNNSPAVHVQGNIVRGCTTGIFLPASSNAQVLDNSITNCGTGVLGDGFVDANFYRACSNPIDTANLQITSGGWSVAKDGVTLSGPTITTQIPIVRVGRVFNGTVSVVVYTSLGTSVWAGSLAIAYDGTSLTATLQNYYAPGAVSLSSSPFVVSGGELVLQVFNAGSTRTDSKIMVKFSGTHVFS